MTMDWETAFFRQYQDACIGRLLRGILHNLNGANQAFSLQAALLKSMFAQSEQLLAEARAACARGDASGLTALETLLGKRAAMVGQMEEKVATSQRIVARVLPVAQLYEPEGQESVPLQTIVDLEMEIMAADSFFKHRIAKTVDLAPDLPPLRRRCLDLHTLLFVLLDNATHALRHSEQPTLALTARLQDTTLVIAVDDSGPGIAPEVAGRIFEPFVTTREGALGVGLFLARKTAVAMGGSIAWDSCPGRTRFTVAIPLAEVT